MEVFQSDALFRIWAYSVGHSQLLIRSLAEETFDLLFNGVKRIYLPDMLKGIVVRYDPASSFDRFTRVEILSQGETYFVEAPIFQIYNSKLRYDESILFDQNMNRVTLVHALYRKTD